MFGRGRHFKDFIVICLWIFTLVFFSSDSREKLNSCVQCGSNKLPLLLLLRCHPPGSLAPERAYSLFVNIQCSLRSKYQYDGSVKIFTLKIWTEQLRESFYIENMNRMVLREYLHWNFEKGCFCENIYIENLKRTVLWAVWGILAFRFTIALEIRLLAGESLWLWRSHLKIRWTFVQLSHSVTQICHKQIWLTFRNHLFELEGGSNGAHGLHVQPNTHVAGWWFCSFSKPLTKKKTLGPFFKFPIDEKSCRRQRFSEFFHTGVWRLGWDFVRHHRDWWVPREHYRCATYV